MSMHINQTQRRRKFNKKHSCQSKWGKKEIHFRQHTYTHTPYSALYCTYCCVHFATAGPFIRSLSFLRKEQFSSFHSLSLSFSIDGIYIIPTRREKIAKYGYEPFTKHRRRLLLLIVSQKITIFVNHLARFVLYVLI